MGVAVHTGSIRHGRGGWRTTTTTSSLGHPAEGLRSARRRHGTVGAATESAIVIIVAAAADVAVSPRRRSEAAHSVAAGAAGVAEASAAGTAAPSAAASSSSVRAAATPASAAATSAAATAGAAAEAAALRGAAVLLPAPGRGAVVQAAVASVAPAGRAAAHPAGTVRTATTSSRRARAAAAHEDLPGLALLAASWGAAAASSSSSAGRWTVPPRPVRLVPVLRHDIYVAYLCCSFSAPDGTVLYVCIYAPRIRQTNQLTARHKTKQAAADGNGGSQFVLEVLEKSGPTLAAQIDRLSTQLSGGRTKGRSATSGSVGRGVRRLFRRCYYVSGGISGQFALLGLLPPFWLVLCRWF